MPPNVQEDAFASLASLDLSSMVAPSAAYNPLTAEVGALGHSDDAAAGQPDTNAQNDKRQSTTTSTCSCSCVSVSATFVKGFGPAAVIPKTEDINIKYFIEYHSRELGRGRKTIVRRCTERSTGNRLAVKSVKKSDGEEYENMLKEANFLAELDHPNIVKLYDTYEDNSYLHMVLELSKGGELYDRVIAKAKSRERHYAEHEAADIVRKVLDAVSYLHSNNIAHRDLKLENILFKSKPGKTGTNTDIRLIDFGLSRRMESTTEGTLRKLHSFVGTNYYVAPEVLDCSYTQSCDLWSVGVLAYALLSARPPFVGKDDNETYSKIRHCDETGVEFPSPHWDDISDGAKDFIRLLLQKDASKRPSAAELRQHEWILEQTREADAYRGAKESTPSIFKKVFHMGRSGKKKASFPMAE